MTAKNDMERMNEAPSPDMAKTKIDEVCKVLKADNEKLRTENDSLKMQIQGLQNLATQLSEVLVNSENMFSQVNTYLLKGDDVLAGIQLNTVENYIKGYSKSLSEVTKSWKQ